MSTDRYWPRLAALPTTTLRVVVALVLVLGTALRYLASATWQPSDGWLLFVGGVLGVETATFFVKRKTEWTPEQRAAALAPLAGETPLTARDATLGAGAQAASD